MMQPCCKSLGQTIVMACLLLFSLPLYAQSRFSERSTRYLPIGTVDQEKGKTILEAFRKCRIAAPYYFDFELKVVPRIGDIRSVRGTLWGANNALGPISRIQIAAADKQPQERFLIQNGPQNSILFWSSEHHDVVPALPFEPVAGTDITPFDLQMPYIYWEYFEYEGIFRHRNRPTHRFLLYPPRETNRIYPELKAIRIFLDTQFNALVKTEYLGPEMKTMKTMMIMNIKKVQDQWIAKDIEIRDENHRGRTVFLIKAAAMNIAYRPELFDSSRLNIESPVLPDKDKQYLP